MHINLATALLFLVAGAASAADPGRDAEAWITSSGGGFEKDSAGHIVSLDLRSTWITDADLARVGGLGELRRLDLSHTKITDVGLEHLRPLQNMIDLNCYYAEYVSEEGIAHVKSWSRLERLNLRGTKVTSKVFEHLARLTRLKWLDVAFTQIDDDGVEQLAALPNLESLAIGGNRLNGSALTALKLMPGLRHLDAGGIQRVDAGLWGLPLSDINLDRLGELTTLVSLNLSGANLADRGTDRPGQPQAQRTGMRDLSKLAHLTNLKKLDLSLTPVSGKDLAALTTMKSLEELRLAYAANIDDSAAAPLASMPKLAVLYLTGTNVTGKTLDRLASARSLKHLDVTGARITNEETAQFRRTRPDCQLIQ